MDIDLFGLALLIAGAFGVSILYLFLIRQASRSHREKVIDLIKALGVGSTFTIVAALVLSFLMLIPIIVVIVILEGMRMGPPSGPPFWSRPSPRS